MVFAIIYKRPFIALPAHPQRIGRMLSLLTDLGLQDRFYPTYADVFRTNAWKKTIPYEQVHQQLELKRTDSLNFLFNSLNASKLSK